MSVNPMETLDTRLAVAGQTCIQEATRLLHQASSDFSGRAYGEERWMRLQQVLKQLDQLQDDAQAHVDETFQRLLNSSK